MIAAIVATSLALPFAQSSSSRTAVVPSATSAILEASVDRVLVHVGGQVNLIVRGPSSAMRGATVSINGIHWCNVLDIRPRWPIDGGSVLLLWCRAEWNEMKRRPDGSRVIDPAQFVFAEPGQLRIAVLSERKVILEATITVVPLPRDKQESLEALTAPVMAGHQVDSEMLAIGAIELLWSMHPDASRLSRTDSSELQQLRTLSSHPDWAELCRTLADYICLREAVLGRHTQRLGAGVMGSPLLPLDDATKSRFEGDSGQFVVSAIKQCGRTLIERDEQWRLRDVPAEVDKKGANRPPKRP